MNPGDELGFLEDGTTELFGQHCSRALARVTKGR